MGCASDVVGSSAIGSPPVLCTQTPTALRPVRSFPARPGWSSLQRLLWRLRIGVGMVIADDPLHGSRRAALPHRALALRHDGKHHRWPWVHDASSRDEAV